MSVCEKIERITELVKDVRSVFLDEYRRGRKPNPDVL